MATITEDGLRKTVEEARGTLLVLPRLLDNEPPPQNGGCGCWTHVAGTNGGKMRCGGMLTQFSVTEPYYCGYCSSGWS